VPQHQQMGCSDTVAVMAPSVTSTSPLRHGRASGRDTGRVTAAITVYGVVVLVFMMLMYALERRGRIFVLAFGVGCLLSSSYGFLSGAWPFGVVEAIWAVIAVIRFARTPSGPRVDRAPSHHIDASGTGPPAGRDGIGLPNGEPGASSAEGTPVMIWQTPSLVQSVGFTRALASISRSSSTSSRASCCRRARTSTSLSARSWVT
jgi:hypothetical protein